VRVPIITTVSRLRFEGFELDLAGGGLRKGNAVIRLQPQPLKVLTLLAARAGQVVSREEIQKRVWPDNTFVDFEQGLNYCIKQIRAALRDAADAPRIIETIPKRGYRFLAAVESVAASTDQRLMLVVLPFQNLSGDPEQEYFSDGLTEEMSAQLGRLYPARLGVIARTSAMRYKRTDKSIAMIGRELNVSHALEGSVRRSGSRVRVTAQLILVADETHVWSQSFERPAGDILALQADVARAIAREIGIQLTPQQQSRLARPPVEAAAYEAYLKGRHFWKKRSRDALQKSVGHFERAIELAPDYAAAYAGLADVYLTQLDYSYLRPRDAFALADRVLLEALRLDNTVAEPHTSLGHLRLHEFNWKAAEERFTHAITLNPGYDTAHYYYANLLAAFGRFDDGIVEADRALELDPLSANTRQNRLFILYLARRYDEAIDVLTEALEIDPEHAPLYYYLGLIRERQHKYEEALEALSRVGSESQNRGATVLAAIGFTHGQAGHRDRAIAALHELEHRSNRDYVSSYDLALVHLAAGNRDRAFELLSAAYDEYSSFLPFVKVDARWDEVREDERFQAIVHRMKFPAL
jgi:TolB-like protein/Tfp pilus assembly protein PilF